MATSFEYNERRNDDFAKWLNLVDRHTEVLIGVSTLDLPDINYYDLWEDGVPPKSAALKAIRGLVE